jgi:methyltransferase
LLWKPPFPAPKPDGSAYADRCSAITPEQKTALIGTIARACAVFCVDEIIVFDDGQTAIKPPEPSGYTAFSDPGYFFYHVLSFLETPPYLRRTLFPMHPDLKLAGALPSLDMPHHLRSDEWCPFREAVTVRPIQSNDGKHGTLVDAGLSSRMFVPVQLEEKTRVTLKLPEDASTSHREDKLQECEAVSPDIPRETAGYYWGYSVRQASSLSTVFTESPYDDGYDVSIGTSERGVSADTILQPDGASYVTPTWAHLLVVLGGVAGIEAALAADKDLQQAGVTEAKDLFDSWINLVPSQGSRTIRTEEAIWIALTTIHPALRARNAS